MYVPILDTGDITVSKRSLSRGPTKGDWISSSSIIFSSCVTKNACFVSVFTYFYISIPNNLTGFSFFFAKI